MQRCVVWAELTQRGRTRCSGWVYRGLVGFGTSSRVRHLAEPRFGIPYSSALPQHARGWTWRVHLKGVVDSLRLYRGRGRRQNVLGLGLHILWRCHKSMIEQLQSKTVWSLLPTCRTTLFVRYATRRSTNSWTAAPGKSTLPSSRLEGNLLSRCVRFGEAPGQSCANQGAKSGDLLASLDRVDILGNKTGRETGSRSSRSSRLLSIVDGT
ncbi:hypothetical protein IWX49DRAFT_360031 [Phyllosticta citricarpa]|uniref:Uncharacterized protein n=2 Tax=Phyllosticta TaxID=121621 RepID=A0ABR1L4F6_9PEZI